MSRGDLWLYILQRASAMILAPLVVIHLVTIVIAIQGGLSAAEILGRTQGNMLWGTMYSLFVVAAAVHGSIGLRVIVREMTGWRGRSLDILIVLFGLSLTYLGARAVMAVI